MRRVLLPLVSSFGELSSGVAERLGGFSFLFGKKSLRFSPKCRFCLASWLAALWGYLLSRSSPLLPVGFVFRASLLNYPEPLSEMPLGHAPSPSTFDYFVIRGNYLARTRSGPARRKARRRNLTHCDFIVTTPAIKSGSCTGLGTDVSGGSSWSWRSSCLELSSR